MTDPTKQASDLTREQVALLRKIAAAEKMGSPLYLDELFGKEEPMWKVLSRGLTYVGSYGALYVNRDGLKRLAALTKQCRAEDCTNQIEFESSEADDDGDCIEPFCSEQCERDQRNRDGAGEDDWREER
jgi:hypothetical protein